MSAACFSPNKILLSLLLALLPACAVTTKAKPDAERVATAWDRKEELRKTCEELAGRPDFRGILGCDSQAAVGGAKGAAGGTAAPK
jgi:hypothetical protein